jgi:hypothetical protein
VGGDFIFPADYEAVRQSSMWVRFHFSCRVTPLERAESGSIVGSECGWIASMIRGLGLLPVCQPASLSTNSYLAYTSRFLVALCIF